MQSTHKRKSTPREKKLYTCEWCGSGFSSASNNPPKYCGSKCRDRSRYDRHHDARLAAVQEYRAANKEEIRERRRLAWAENPERGRARNRVNYLRHREKRVAEALEYQRSNPEVVARTRNKRRAAVSYAITSRDLQRLTRQYRGACAYCAVTLSAFGRSEGTSLQWDHVVPLSRGGTNGIGNIVPSCRSCNLEKNAKFLTEWKNRWYLRAGAKDGADELRDLEKARWYVEREIQRVVVARGVDGG